MRTEDEVRNHFSGSMGESTPDSLPFLQISVLVEIAAQLARANEISAFKLELDSGTVLLELDEARRMK